MPDYEREVSRPNSRAKGWNILATPGTYVLLAINIAVFGWMVMHGVSAKDPTVPQLIHYGATNSGYVILGHQWWRLLTATFVHVGLLHIATNMWCLWNLGLLGEPLLGPVGLVAVYLITGIAGNLLSLCSNVLFRDYSSVGAGASGAVFGIAGILIVLLSNKKLPIPAFELNRLRRSVIQFAVLNLIIGIGANFYEHRPNRQPRSHWRISEWIGFGVPLVPRMTSGRTRYLQRQKLTFAGAAFLLFLFAYFITKLR